MIAPTLPAYPGTSSWIDSYLQLGTGSVATRTDLESVASSPSESQVQVAAENAPLRIVYGRTRIGAQIADVLTHGSFLVIVAVWCEGEIGAVESVEVNDAAVPSGVTITSYTGTAGQTVDATLVAAYASHGVTFNDAFAGIAYSVVKVASGTVDGFPNLAAIIQGRKVYDPRTTLTAYSDNPALALADFIESTSYGMARDVNWASVETAADFCDETVGTEKRRLIGLVLDNVSPTRQWLEALRTYAGCWIGVEGSEIRLIPDTPGSSVMSFTDANIVAGSLKLKKRGVQQVPTLVEIRYTDTTLTPWAERPAVARQAGVDEGTTPRRESQVSLPGVQRYSQAYREAIERLNKLTLSDLEADFVAFDEALAVQVGDIVDVTHSIGLSAKLMRVLAIRADSPGRWRISASEYDPGAYSDTVQAEPVFEDTDLPSPAAPPALSGFAVTEEVYQLENGIYSSRLALTWTAAEYAYLDAYRVEVYRLGLLIDTSTTLEAAYRTGPVQESVEYVCKVASISATGALGEWSQINFTPAGKALIPGNVPSLTTFEVGGTVYVSWQPAVDIDIWRYEVRYGSTAGTWDTATLIDRVDALRLTTSEIAAGTWRFYVKALDSVGQYSTTAATSDVTVTSDSNSFFVDAYDQNNPTLTNMASFSLDRCGLCTHYVSEDGVMAATKFPNQADTYTNVAATYQASQTSTWLGEANDDFGQVLSGQWTATATVAALAGTLTSYIGLSDDGSSWTYTAGLSLKDTGRFARLKHETTTTSVLKVTVPTQRIRLDAIPREEVGSGTSSATLATTITLDNAYTAVKSLSITPAGSTNARIAVYDNVTMGAPSSFDVYIFDAADTQVACDFYYNFKGV